MFKKLLALFRHDELNYFEKKALCLCTIAKAIYSEKYKGPGFVGTWTGWYARDTIAVKDMVLAHFPPGIWKKFTSVGYLNAASKLVSKDNNRIRTAEYKTTEQGVTAAKEIWANSNQDFRTACSLSICRYKKKGEEGDE